MASSCRLSLGNISAVAMEFGGMQSGVAKEGSSLSFAQIVRTTDATASWISVRMFGHARKVLYFPFLEHQIYCGSRKNSQPGRKLAS
jgi:hypothetical protein